MSETTSSGIVKVIKGRPVPTSNPQPFVFKPVREENE